MGEKEKEVTLMEEENLPTDPRESLLLELDIGRDRRSACSFLARIRRPCPRISREESIQPLA